MRYYFSQYDTGPKVDGDFGRHHQVREIVDLLRQLPAGLALNLELEGLDHNGPEGAGPQWFTGWRDRALALIRRYTAPGLAWVVTVNGDVSLVDEDDQVAEEEAGICLDCR